MTTTHQTVRTRLGLVGLALLLGLGVLTSCGADEDKSAGDAGSSSAGGGQGAAETEQSAGADKGDGKGDGKGDQGDQGADEGDTDADAGDGSDDADDTGTSGDAGSSGDADFDDGADSDEAAEAEDASSPFVVAAAAVGTRSRETVVTLHALGLSTTSDRGVPHQLLPDQGKKLRGALREQVGEASRLKPPKGSAAARLVSSLNAYSRAAGKLAKWAPRSGPLPQAWFNRLGKADQAWLQALRDLSDAAGADLLKDLPELLMPSA